MMLVRHCYILLSLVFLVLICTITLCHVGKADSLDIYVINRIEDFKNCNYKLSQSVKVLILVK